MSLVLNPVAWLRNLALALAVVLTVGVSMGGVALGETKGQRSTRNVILGATAAVAAIILYNNYHHKQVAHNTLVGYTRDGGRVYADGRVVYPNGDVLYTSNDGRQVCRYDGYGDPCGPRAYAYRTRYDEEHFGRGHAYGHHNYEHEHEGDNNQSDGGDENG